MCSGTCRAGYYCPEGSTTELECGGKRFFCPEGSSRRERVLSGGGVGPANPDKGAFYTVGDVSKAESTLTRSDQKRCPQGSYCKSGNRYLCPAGRYGSRVGEDQDTCTGKCAEGFYCPEGSTKAHEKACGGPSHYCPEGSSAPVQVMDGYFSYASPTKHLVGALGYPEESFYTALTTTNTTGLRKTAEAICDPGHYCVDGVRLECPIGRYGDTYGLTNSDCTGECEPGYFCNKASKVKNEHECGGSHLFCPRGTGIPKHVHLATILLATQCQRVMAREYVSWGCTATIPPAFNFNVRQANMVALMVYLIWRAREIVLPGTTVLQAPPRPNRNTVMTRTFTVLKVLQPAN